MILNPESKPFQPFDPWYDEDLQTQWENLEPEPTVRSHENLLGEQSKLISPNGTKWDPPVNNTSPPVEEEDDLLDFDFDEALLD